MNRISFSSDYTQQLSRLLQLLGDETRLRIVLCLAQGEANVTELCEWLELPQSTVSHHLGLLRLADLLTTRREGRQVFYAVSKSAWRDLAGGFFDQLPEGSGRTLKLDSYLIMELRDPVLTATEWLLKR